MTIDKRMKYEMQGGSKPARNYLGTQKTVSGIPVKWKSGPDAPSTELAYITKAEKDLLLKKNLHGSLKNGPNTGPDGIMSLDSQGDYTRDRSPQGRSRQGQAQHDAQMKSILTGQKNIGQTTKTGPKTRKYAVPEYAKVKQKDGTYKNKYIGSGYKSYGTPSFFGNLFSRGAPGYRGIKGMPAFFGKPGFEARQGPEGFGYYSDKENFGDTRDAMPFGIMGLIANAINKFKKPKDMTEFNKLTLGGTHPAALDFDPDAKIQDTAFSKTLSDKYKYSRGPQEVNLPGPYEQAETDYWSDKQVINTPGGEIVIDSQGNEVVDTPNVPMGTPWDNPYKAPEKSMMEKLSDFYQNNSFNPFKMSEAGAADLTDEELINRARKQAGLTTDSTTDIVGAGGEIVPDLSNADVLNQIAIQSGMPTEKEGFYGLRKDVATPGSASTIRDIQNYKRNPDLQIDGQPFGVKDIMGLGFDRYNQLGEEKVQSIYDMVNLPNQGPFIGARGGRVGYANGGLASLFTRRG